MSRYREMLEDELKNRSPLCPSQELPLLSKGSGPHLLTVKAVHTRDISGKICSGEKWVEDHRRELLKAGFTEEDIFQRKLPLGILHCVSWDKPGLGLVIEEGVITVSWKNAQGNLVLQRIRPEKRNRRVMVEVEATCEEHR